MALNLHASPQFCLLTSKHFSAVSFGEEHPFKVQRYRLAYDLIEELGLGRGPTVSCVEAPLATEEILGNFHRQDYLQRLREFSLSITPRADFRFGLGDVENPVFPEMYDWSRLCCGATLEAMRLVVEDRFRAAFNPAGGYHHAQPARASGFSYLNDAAIAIRSYLDRGLRIAYLDLDAHHGDGVQQAFYDTDRVLTISVHENGKDFYPHTGFADELGEGAGYGYAVNIPLLRHADDLIFEQALTRMVLPLLRSYHPDLLVTQAGVDGMRTDPLARLELTTRSYEFAARSLASLGIPWVILGGGGYDKCNVARCWALFWAAACGIELSDCLPPGFRARARSLGWQGESLRDAPHLAQPGDFARAQRDLERVLGFLERRLEPVHGISRRRGA
ncbi:acetoin utilization protein AcuC [Desulfuromonas sp. DDH964]|uniref:acetoin utilization protein AcuC n=1 Tax=Desulfuromonas sp. DDH964 TaxID=1823759 RepID=UPI00078B68C6|nr:acetoin utilization protein AcuC [Desulfuromonas sp. DDH964]AMV72344.1 histone deacetylase family protein [Desulfuromonas sp. DDH964]